MKTAREINKIIAAAAKRGRNVYADNGAGRIRIVRAKTVSGRVFGRCTDGRYSFLMPCTEIVEA